MPTLVTDVLDLLGVLVLVAAAALSVGLYVAVPAGLATAGVGLLATSWLIDHAAHRRTRRTGAGEEDT